MRILILNRGSSSLKCSLYDLESFPSSFIPPLWEAHSEKLSFADQAKTLERLLHSCPESHKIDGIGHRIVHGGKFYTEMVFIDETVKKNIRFLADLAPLHNLADLEGIEILEKLFKGVPQMALFDTAFHHTLPESVAVYPGPYAWVEAGIRRYGFHGTSFQYCSRRASEILAKDLHSMKMVICHLGSGASLCAIKEGKSIDTTMGLTPLEGLMMDTRSGSVDPGILLYLLSKKGYSADELSKELYEKSGLLGLSGLSGDMRDILEKASNGNTRAKLAFDVYIHRLNSCIGSMLASLEGMDTLVFTAGIGENAPLVRKRICKSLLFLGLRLDENKNEKAHDKDCILSAPDSKVKILLIHTQEAFEIARECWKKLSRAR